VYSSMVAYTKTVHTFGPVVQFCPKVDMCSYNYTAALWVYLCVLVGVLCVQSYSRKAHGIYSESLSGYGTHSPIFSF